MPNKISLPTGTKAELLLLKQLDDWKKLAGSVISTELFGSLDNKGGGSAFMTVLASVESTVEEMLVVTTLLSDSSILG